MNLTYLGNLAALSVSNPAAAARQLIDLKLSKEALWLGLGLAVVLNTFLQALSNLLVPAVNSELQGPEVSFVLYVAIVGGGLILTIAASHRVGLFLGGTGSFADIMVLMVWLQFLRVALQTLSLIVLLTFPALLSVLVFAVFLLGLYIMVHFIDQGHRLGSPLKAFGVIILSALAIAVLVTLLLSLVGAPTLGMPAHV